MNRDLTSKVLIGGGLLLAIVGVVLWATGDGDGATASPDSGPAATAAAGGASTNPTVPSTSSSSSTSSSTTSSTAAPDLVETPEEFLAVLDAGLASDDIEAALFDRLHQATIDRYGEAACRAYLASLPPQQPGLRIREVGPPASWSYQTDGIALTIADATPVEVDRVISGETVVQELHWALVDGRYRWFTDCGDPVSLG